MPPPTTARSQRVIGVSVTLLVLASEAITCERVYQSRARPDSPRRGAPGSLGQPPGARLAARARPVRRRLVPPWRLPRPRRDPRGVDSPPLGSEGRCPRALPPRAAGDRERPEAQPERLGARDGLPRARAVGPRPGRARRHLLASGRRAPRHGVRPRSDRARRSRPPAREALVHEPRVRARTGDVHHLGATRSLPCRPRPRRLPHEPQARPPPAGRARADGYAALARPRGRASGGAVPVPIPTSRDHRPVRRAEAAAGNVTAD